MAKEDLVGAVEIIKALEDLDRTPKKDPGREQVPLLSESGIAALTEEDVETFLAKLDEFNGK